MRPLLLILALLLTSCGTPPPPLPPLPDSADSPRFNCSCVAECRLHGRHLDPIAIPVGDVCMDAAQVPAYEAEFESWVWDSLSRFCDAGFTVVACGCMHSGGCP